MLLVHAGREERPVSFLPRTFLLWRALRHSPTEEGGAALIRQRYGPQPVLLDSRGDTGTMPSMHARGKQERPLRSESCDRLTHLVQPLGKRRQATVHAVVAPRCLPTGCSGQFRSFGMCPLDAVSQQEGTR